MSYVNTYASRLAEATDNRAYQLLITFLTEATLNLTPIHQARTLMKYQCIEKIEHDGNAFG